MHRLMILCCVAMAAAGCVTFKGDRETGLEPPTDDGGDYWRIKPVELRVYPSTRFVFEQDEPVLEAHVEFKDEAGDTTKAVGDFRFDLFEIEKTGEVRIGERLYTWEVPMRTLEANRRFYDPITRSYRFRLKLDEAVLGDQAVMLVVTFMPPGERRLQGRQRLKATFEGLE